MYSDMTHLIPPTLAPPVSVTAPVGPHVSVPVTKTVSSHQVKEKTRSPPVNVVITSSDPLPMCTTAPTPILSVTIPPEHIKGTPHNYQITMPSTNDGQIRPPSFTATPNKNAIDTAKTFPIWNPSTTFKSTEQHNTMPTMTSVSESTKFPLLGSQKIGGLFTNSISDNLNTSNVSPDTSHNKSRTLSEKSNTSLDNYDPCPDFKPIIPLPDEVKVTTGEEEEAVVFCARAKLFRFVDKQWKERGIGEMKLLKHNTTGKVRVLMRRDQVHKICANHIITAEMEIQPMKNESKAYFWVANDFADETVILEKFCIRFKTADIANEFYQAFLDAIKNAKSILNYSVTLKEENQTKTIVDKKNNISNQQNKSVVGGFTFNTTPTFKSMNDSDKKENKSQEPKVTVVNPFSNLSLKTANSSLSNILNSGQSKVIDGDFGVKADVQSKVNTSDTMDDFEPAINFKPVIPLPPLIDHKTGEENENVIFEQRAKLLRFDAARKEWKECGLGNIKLLVQKDNVQKARLLMRREQVLIVCCNHALTTEMNFQKMPNVDKAVTWCAVDSSIGELMPQTFCLRFKTSQMCDDFINAVKSAQSKMVCNTKAAKEEQNATKHSNQIGFGDKFKAKPGSWFCDSCYTNNLDSFMTCACCETPNPLAKKPGSIASTIDKVASSWGDQFKPKSGSWECKTCLVRNEDSVENCSACNTPKDSTMPKNELKSIFGGNTKLNFSFGVPSQADATGDTNHDIQTSVGWGDKFKPKPGSWECEQCLIRNENNTSKCNACGSFKDSSLETKEQPSIFGNLSSVPKFVFGIPKSNEVSHDKPKSESLSMFDGSGTHKFTFGSQSMDISVKSGLNFKFGLDNKISEEKVSDFGMPTITKSADAGVINFSMKQTEESKASPTKPALLPTPPLENVTTPTIPSFVPKEHNSFDFVLKSKTINTNSPVKSTKNDESIENEYASEDEGNHIHFSPVVPMPDKIKVFTGEENENELYAQRAKLFRFVGHEWKERGIGVVKILKHKETGKLRVVMRREQVLKICLNHALTNEITYVPKDQKTWLFTANDFSETVLTLQQFCLRFQTKEIAEEFKNAISNALEGLKCHDKKDSEDIVFVSETQSTPQEKQRAKELMLPENFFCYKNKAQCSGCRGCKNDDGLVSNSQVCSTPIMISSRDSPTNSIYGTPVVLNTTADLSIFHTPLEAVSQNNQKSSLKNESSINSTFTTDHEDDKEISFVIKSTLTNLSSILENTSLDSTLASNTIQTPTGVKSSILASPKLNSTGAAKKGENVKFPTFGNDQIKPSFSSAVDNEPAFPFNNVTNNPSVNTDLNSENKTCKNNDGIDKLNLATTKSSEKNDDVRESKSESQSIFTTNKTSNVFSAIGQEKIFGTTGNSKTSFVFGNVTGSIFAPNSHNDNKTITSENPVFGLGNKQWQFGSMNENKEDESKENKETVSQQSNEENSIKAENNDDKKENIFKIDNSLSFAALSNAAPGFSQKKSNFSWEGAGQQIFGNTKKESENDTTGQDKDGEGEENSSTEKDNEEYDPHYEPIVSLPDVIVVTTGEEDEEKLYWERCKLYRYDENAKEWKERGVGEIKILYHPTRKSYRLLLRRELVHKLVLNMLLFADFGLLPMKNSDRAWTWAGRNYAENPSGDQELLAVRFKSSALAESFKKKVTECIKEIQANAGKDIRGIESVKNNTESVIHQQNATSLMSEPALTEVGEQSTELGVTQVTEVSDASNDSGTVLLRLPKHLTDSARVDSVLAQANLAESSKNPQMAQGNNNIRQVSQDGSRLQVHFQEPAVEEEEEEIDEVVGEEDDYEQSNHYYDDQQSIESTTFFTCEAEVHILQNDKETSCDQAQVQLFYCSNWYSPKIMIVDSSTGEILTDMVIDGDSEFKNNFAKKAIVIEVTVFEKNGSESQRTIVVLPALEQLMRFQDICVGMKLQIIWVMSFEITDYLTTLLQLNDASVSWTGADCTSSDPIEKTITVTFSDADTATQFYSACEENI
ncbi:E3 SUMO-protein ligase RanBP2 [Eumeta japonica]|uniref:E3 SUMO-protein ligase RanBP2 n=1 Tax=Eumeta variegata TaxID=151549 RepID=A0A4C1X932_EUMVA|nr:E3 SUMO-protein ligase RanBP2 [Eumeta japonica]